MASDHEPTCPLSVLSPIGRYECTCRPKAKSAFDVLSRAKSFCDRTGTWVIYPHLYVVLCEAYEAGKRESCAAAEIERAYLRGYADGKRDACMHGRKEIELRAKRDGLIEGLELAVHITFERIQADRQRRQKAEQQEEHRENQPTSKEKEG